jgi:hypothetical protein
MGVFLGMSTGIAIAVFLMLTGRDPYRGRMLAFSRYAAILPSREWLVC